MKNKVILITGSSSGIGAAIAIHSAQAGYDVVVTYNSDQKAGAKVLDQVKSHGGEGLLIQVDVASESSVKDMFEKVDKTFGRLDAVVCNAAVDWPNPIETASFEDDWRAIMGTKLDGSYLTTKYALPLLKKSPDAHIIYIASAMHYQVDPLDPAYCVATGGVVTLMKCMVKALAKYNIRVNAVAPGAVRGTNLGYYKAIGATDEFWEELVESSPMKQLATPETVAKTVRTVIEEPTGIWNGNMIYVNGGSHLG